MIVALQEIDMTVIVGNEDNAINEYYDEEEG